MATAETVQKPGEDTFLPDVSQGKMGMWVFLASEVVVFGGLITVFLLFRLGNPEWKWWACQQQLKEFIGTFNTIVLLTSSWTIVMAYRAFDQDRSSAGNGWLLATVLLGFLFLGVKAYEWYSEIQHGYFPGSPYLVNTFEPEHGASQTNLFWSFYYIMTGLHGVHVLGGVMANLLIWLGSVLGWTEDNTTRLEYAGLYWHFVDIVWVFLFPIFYLMFPLTQGGGH